MTLADAKEGDKLVVVATVGDDVTIQAQRFGISEGALISVGKNIPGGPVIIVRKQMELAVGRQLARAIEVSLQSGASGS
ncbi:MAG: ferrous iron transport protein A [Cyanobacteria bacterium REEB67]|nr:ferrous iron transport protein A [Cyanobacteria bacterium REEB67]